MPVTLTKYNSENTAALDIKYGPVITQPQHMQDQLGGQPLSSESFADYLKTLVEPGAVFSGYKAAELVCENFNINSDKLVEYLKERPDGHCMMYKMDIPKRNCKAMFYWIKIDPLWKLVAVRDQTNLQSA